ncbi:MAG TPA: hypothetical protein DCY74_00905 [Clostridiales bacterium]|nr:hypothetical protein [Clostridiales bacterium]
MKNQVKTVAKTEKMAHFNKDHHAPDVENFSVLSEVCRRFFKQLHTGAVLLHFLESPVMAENRSM